MQGRLVIGENAAQAAQFAASGAAEGALLPHSQALAPALAERGGYVLVAEALHGPVVQAMVLLAGAGDTARALCRFLQTREAQAILQRHGFSPP
jgi:molybdate transport system substrate-binding protein